MLNWVVYVNIQKMVGKCDIVRSVARKEQIGTVSVVSSTSSHDGTLYFFSKNVYTHNCLK